MTVRVLNSNNVTTYNLTSLSHHAQLPDWLAKRNAKSLKKDLHWSRRISLIQDFGFPEAALRLKFTPNQKHIVGCGVYKPQMRIFDLQEMSMKLERHTNTECVDFIFLGDDWQKMVVLGADRTVEFHGSGSVYHGTRIPRAGRAMAYDWRTCDLLVVGSSPEVYRLNLDRGQYMKSLETDTQSGLNAIDIGPFHGLYGVAGDCGLVEFWDRRERQRVACLQAMSVDSDQVQDMTSIKFLPGGMAVAVGDSAGMVRIFDLRSSRPLHSIDHKYGQPVKGIYYHTNSDCLLSFDSQALRITKAPMNECQLLTTVSPGVKINDVCQDGSTGFLAMAVEDNQIHSYYCPSLGPAPRWASYLDHVVHGEDGEDGSGAGKPTHYDNYKFVTRAQLADLSLGHLVGSKLLRAYMHGYFIDLRLYEKAKAIANPFGLEQYRREQAEQKLEAERASRISATAAKPKKAAVQDSRFRRHLDEDPDFRVDEHRAPEPHIAMRKKK